MKAQRKEEHTLYPYELQLSWKTLADDVSFWREKKNVFVKRCFHPIKFVFDENKVFVSTLANIFSEVNVELIL